MKSPRQTRLVTLAVQLLLVCVMVSPVSAKSALGELQLGSGYELGYVAPKSLNVLDVFLDFKRAALGCCVGPDKTPEINVPDKNYNPVNPGPLDKDIADTFRSGTYTEKVTTQETTLYRVISDDGNPAGSYLTREKPQGPLQSVIDSALDQNWGNTATRVVEVKIPPGTKLYEGAAASQRGLVGGGNQIYIPKVDPKWVVE